MGGGINFCYNIKMLTNLKLITLLGLCVLLSVTSMAQSLDVLVFSKTEGFRHNSIEAGVSAIQSLGEQHDFGVVATEDASVFTTENLQNYDVVMFLNTTGNVLDNAQQDAFEGFIQQGGGFVGVHAASDTEYEWPWYGQLVGAYFESHPRIQEATILVEDTTNVSTKHLPVRWQRTDEWYNYSDNPRGKVHVLARLDESSYRGGNMGDDHPIAWMHEFDGGRAWYTGGGHTKESYEEPAFLVHILGGIRYAAGVDGDASAGVGGDGSGGVDEPGSDDSQ